MEDAEVEKAMRSYRSLASRLMDKGIYKVLKLYATLRGLNMQDLYAEALIMYAKHVWNNEFDEEDREYVKKKLKVDKKTIEILEGVMNRD